MSTKTLILGGIKSGKSRYAEILASQWNGRINLIATATANDGEMSARIERHKSDRNPRFKVIEEPIYLGEAIAQHAASDCIVVDCLTLWITNLLMMSESKTLMASERANFIESVKISRSRILFVSNESNMGIIPFGELSRRYCDEIGSMHQELASICDEVYLMVAGIPLQVSPSKAL
ncbi:MAG: adenosylcobinamide kinase/adenosylcobinamide-phosphate guanylyltransferase [Granulosicoccus sp.]|jgi:adenosylcobinamide kinase/adenosylcobinamide-phosphate guanylyltransferase